MSISFIERKKHNSMKTIVFYDNLCSVCNYWVNWILKNDKRQVFYFVALESDFAKTFSRHFKYQFPAETIVIWDEYVGFLQKSDAVIFILKSIQPSSFQFKALKFLPKHLRDAGYSIFAYFRRFIPMRKCEIPSSEDKKNFLTDVPFQVFLNNQKK